MNGPRVVLHYAASEIKKLSQLRKIKYCDRSSSSIGPNCDVHVPPANTRHRSFPLLFLTPVALVIPSLRTLRTIPRNQMDTRGLSARHDEIGKRDAVKEHWW